MNAKIPVIHDRQLVIEHTFQAPCEKVWSYFTDPVLVSRWWGPHGWKTDIITMNVRPGGIWHYHMQLIDGDYCGLEAWGKTTYDQVLRPYLLTGTDIFADQAGEQVANTSTMFVTISFEKQGTATKVRSITSFRSDEAVQAAEHRNLAKGMAESWERLAQELHKSTGGI